MIYRIKDFFRNIAAEFKACFEKKHDLPRQMRRHEKRIRGAKRTDGRWRGGDCTEKGHKDRLIDREIFRGKS